MPAKFELSSFECIGSVGHQLRYKIDGPNTQVRGPEHSRRQSLM